MKRGIELTGNHLKEIADAISKEFILLDGPEIENDIVKVVVGKDGWTGTYFGAFKVESTIEATIDRMLNRFREVWR
jgi:hypothetical protein